MCSILKAGISTRITNINKYLDSLDSGNTNGNGNANARYEHDDDNSNAADGIACKQHDDDYYIDAGTEPPRFEYYKQVRKKSFANWWDYDVRTTTDELNFYLKRQLKYTPEERYQSKKKGWLFHPSNMDNQHNIFNGCNNLRCIPGCRFYEQYGRFEDEEVIAEHNKYIEHLKQKNAIMEIELIDGWYDNII